MVQHQRTRAWRRFQNRRTNGNGMGSDNPFTPEKNWKLMYGRKDKVVRAKQLGFDYPALTTRQLLDREESSDGSCPIAFHL